MFNPENYGRLLTTFGTGCVFVGLYMLTPWGYGLAAVGAALLLLACYSRRDGLLILGPFWRVEGRRATRRGRAQWFRVGVIAVVFISLAVGLNHLGSSADMGAAANRRAFESIRGDFMALFGFYFPLAAVLFTAIGVSGVVAEERANKRWEVLLTTDLRPREIVLGKVLSRAFAVLTLAATVLPVVLVLGLFGLLPADAILPMMVLLVAAVLTTAGMVAWRKRLGVALMLVYFLLSLALLSLRFNPVIWGEPGVPVAVEVFAAGNPLATGTLLLNFAAPTPADVIAILPDIAQRCFGAAVVVFVVSVAGACRQLRADGVRMSLAARLGRVAGQLLRLIGLKPKFKNTTLRAKLRPPVSDEPLAWWTANRLGRGSFRAARPATWKFFAVWFAVMMAVFLTLSAFDSIRSWAGRAGHELILKYVPPTYLAESVVWCVIAGIVGFSIFDVVRRAATAVPAERTGDTLETLRLTGLTPREVVDQIHAGSLARFRRLFWVVVAAALAFMFMGRPISPQAVVFGLILLWLVPSVLASIALAVSARASTPVRGMRNALLAIYFGHTISFSLMGIAWETATVDLPRMLGHPDRAMSIMPLRYFWWDWILSPREIANWEAGRTNWMNPYNIPWSGRIPWPVGPVVGLVVMGAGVALYARFGLWFRRHAARKLTKDWQAGPPPTGPPI